MNPEKDPQTAKPEVNGPEPEQNEIDKLLDDLNLKRVESGEMLSNLDNCIIGNLEGSVALADFKSNKRYIDGEEASFILGLNDLGFNTVEQNCFLMQLHNRVMERAQNNLRPEVAIDPNSYSDLGHFIKTNFIMNFNEVVTKYIEKNSTTGKKVDGKIIKPAITLSHLQSVMAGDLTVTSAYYRKNCPNLNNIDMEFESAKYKIEIEKKIDGMRHEVSFKELILELDDDTIEIIETDRQQDSHGVDLILRVKVAEESQNGKYVYASDDDIESGNYNEMDLPIDIKSNRNEAGSALLKLTRDEDSAYGVDHWVMWSHLYSDDFKLSIENDGTISVGGKEDDASVYLQYSPQILAMRDLSDVKYHDNGYGENFTPESLKQRLSDIKREILRGLNVVYEKKAVAV